MYIVGPGARHWSVWMSVSNSADALPLATTPAQPKNTTSTTLRAQPHSAPSSSKKPAVAVWSHPPEIRAQALRGPCTNTTLAQL